MNKGDIDKIKNILLEDEIESPSEEGRLETIKKAQIALESKKHVTAPLLYLLITQIKYMSKFLWLTQILAITLAVVASAVFSTVDEIQGLIFISVPILTFYSIPEIMKTRIYGMSEIESVCKNNLIKIIIIKLIVIGAVNMGSILYITLFLSSKFDMNFIELLVYGLVPFNVMNLLMLSVLKLKSSFAFLSISLISGLILNLIRIYFDISQTIWTGVFIISAILLIFELYRFINNIKERKELILWN